MATHINFEAKTDRELLLLVASQTNTLAEQKIPDIECRLTNIETECKKRAEICGSGYIPYSRKGKLLIGGGASAGGLALVALLAELITRLMHKGI